ncbi:hypothetical protein L7F22_048155 [Adiantum nelumboides]|nr:hypothetical protein [Adiantum nelumboides]
MPSPLKAFSWDTVKKAKWVTGFGYLSSKGLCVAGMLFLMRQGCFKTIVPQNITIKGSNFSMTQPPVGPIFNPQDAPHMAENDDEPVVFDPDDVGQQIEAPEGHLQPRNNAENGAENDVQQPIVDDFIMPPDVDPLPDNVDHWVRRFTCPRRTELALAMDPNIGLPFLLYSAQEIVLAMDPNREGEALAWHVVEVMKAEGLLKHKRVRVRRVLFNEVTKSAVLHAMQAPQRLRFPLVDAHLCGCALDHLVGFSLSPLLWRKLPGSPSAGRLHFAALQLVCNREKAVKEFVPQESWTLDIHACFADESESFLLTALSVNGGSFDAATHPALAEKLKGSLLKVSKVTKEFKERDPPEPYITSTLQEDAQAILGFGAERTMTLAQKLHEGVDLGKGELTGLITCPCTGELKRSFSVVYMDFALSEITSAHVETSAMEMEVSKRQKIGDCLSVVAPMEAATTSSHPLPPPELIENAKGELEEDWQQLLEFANSLLHDYAQCHGVVPEGLEEDDVLHAPNDTKDALRAFTRFTDNACILFVTGRLPSALLLRRWLNAIIKGDIVEEIFEGPRGFYEVLFKSMQARNAVLESVPLFYEGQLVHTVPWRPLAEFQDILKQECPIWVEVQQCPAMYWDLLHSQPMPTGLLQVHECICNRSNVNARCVPLGLEPR